MLHATQREAERCGHSNVRALSAERRSPAGSDESVGPGRTSSAGSGNNMNLLEDREIELAGGGFMASMLAHRPRAPLACRPKCGTASDSDPELLVHQPGDLATIGAALGLAHHVAHDRADRLGVPSRTRSAASALAASAAATIAASSSPPPLPRGPRPRRSRPGSPPSATSRSSTWRPAPTLIRFADDQADERGERRGRHARVGRILPLLRAAPSQIAGEPVGERLSVAGPGRPPAPARPRSSRRARRGRRAAVRSRRSAQLVLEALARAPPAARRSPRGRASSIRSSIATGSRSGSGK